MIISSTETELKSIFLDWEIHKSPVLLATLAEKPSLVLVKYANQRYFSSDLRRSGEEVLGTPDWVSALRRVVQPAGGQEKNFLVALRALAPCDLDHVVICVRGSKRDSRSGLWHPQFIDVVLHRYKSSQIHFYDTGEVDSAEVYTLDGDRTCKVYRHSSYYNGKGRGFDVIINDASEEHTVKNEVWESRWWSNKGNTGTGVKYDLFFHLQEGRTFSDPIMTSPGCKCGRCQIAGAFGDLKHLVRSAIVMVGGCACARGLSDLVSRGKIERALLDYKKYECETPQEFRVALGLNAVADSPVSIVSSSCPEVRLAYAAGFLPGQKTAEVLKGYFFGGVEPKDFPAEVTRGHDNIVTTLEYLSSPAARGIQAKFFWMKESPGPSFEDEGRVLGDYVCYIRKRIVCNLSIDKCQFDPWEGIDIPRSQMKNVAMVPLLFRAPVSNPEEVFRSRKREPGYYTLLGGRYPSPHVLLGGEPQFLTHVRGVPFERIIARHSTLKVLKLFRYIKKDGYWRQLEYDGAIEADGTVAGTSYYSAVIDNGGVKSHAFHKSLEIYDDGDW